MVNTAEQFLAEMRTHNLLVVEIAELRAQLAEEHQRSAGARNLQAQRDRLRAELERLDQTGGLGLKVHERIRAVLANRDGQQP